jgi:hypothetical protein
VTGESTDLLLVAEPPVAKPWQLVKKIAPKGCSYYEIVPFYPSGVTGTCGAAGYKFDAIDQIDISKTGLGTSAQSWWRIDTYDPDTNYCIDGLE